MPSLQNVGFAAASLVTLASTVSAGWSWNKLPYQSEASAGQTGYNNCTGQNNQRSMCQTVVINSIEDFCLWSAPEPNSEIGATEQIEVAYCTREGRGTRSIPAGVLTGVHFRQTPDFVQITGYGDFTKMNIKAGDAGGELDPHGPDGYGNPHGGLVFSDAFGGGMQQIEEWSNFMSATQFCFRACNPNDTGKAKRFCPHVYDVMGCDWNMPSDYTVGTFDTCRADSGEPAGTYGTSTFWQGQPNTPGAHPVPASSSCTKVTDLSYGQPAPSVTGITAVTSVAAATTTSKPVSSSATTAKPLSVSSGINGGAAAVSTASTSSKPNSGFSVKASSAGVLIAAIGLVLFA